MQVQDKSHPQPRRASRPPCSRSSTRKRSTSLSTSSQASAAAPLESARRQHHSRGTEAAHQYPRTMAHEEANLIFSPLLHQRLERERKAESDKAMNSLTASPDIGRAVPSSPASAVDQDSVRPCSSAGPESGRKKGLGFKEMDNVVSTLHKQNFDLKLELYHRRERQVAMEERMEALEAEERKMQQVNSRLLDELEKRDRAVEEAVAMIIALEANVDELLKERGKVPRGGKAALLDQGAVFRQPSSGLGHQTRSLAHMPSFVSDQSDKTETLRNVYLGVGSSLATLARLSEGSPEPVNVLASPSLSVLSESSFVSVYGERSQLDDAAAQGGQRGGRPARRRSASVSRMAAARPRSPLPRSSTAVPFRSISGVASLNEHSGSECSPKSRLQPAAVARMSSQPRSIKRDKRDGLRRVLTDGAGGVRLVDHQDLPPTPDTISTSTLNHMADSNEKLAHKREPDEGVLIRDDCHGARAAATAVMQGQRALMGSISGQRGHLTRLGCRDSPPQQRPRTAGDVAFYTRGNAWNSDSEDSDTHSLESSLDIWLRESSKPAARGSAGRVSPDLFGIPGPDKSGDAQHVENLLMMQQPPFLWPDAPKLAHRRCSLQEQPWTAEKPSEGWKNVAANGVRQGKRLSQELHRRMAMRSPKQQPAEQKQYPPRSGQHGARAGLSRLLRRSAGGSASHPASDSAPSTLDAAAHQGMGVPSRVSRLDDDDEDRSGATPPPIVLNAGQEYMDEGAVLTLERSQSGQGAKTSTDGLCHGRAALVQQQSLESDQGVEAGTRRKWLPNFARINNSKNKSH
ncbi:hypothetical protein CDD81_392 [Ophiocordyceps australis]|uniref:Centrosomin N-terminal motif 1 domain-containing protein n=1 Tax=Ophiocordyceps australis TaxID=1399860 RepID=A0A2C5Y3F7_9HYPO|nr:hypothetical protein CDD81_392 [Ophiocordyceps australis]